MKTSIVRIVDERDLLIDQYTGEYVGSGRNLHHRKLRSRGGTDTASNLVTLSGSGTTGSHGWVHANPNDATRLGLIVPSWIREPADVPLRRCTGPHIPWWSLQMDDGTVQAITPRQAEHIMLTLGIWQTVNSEGHN